MNENNSIDSQNNIYTLFINPKYYKLLTPTMQREMQYLKNQIDDFIRQISSYKKGLLDSLLDEEESMAFMNLTFLTNNPQFYQ